MTNTMKKGTSPPSKIPNLEPGYLEVCVVFQGRGGWKCGKYIKCYENVLAPLSKIRNREAGNCMSGSLRSFSRGKLGFSALSLAAQLLLQVWPRWGGGVFSLRNFFGRAPPHSKEYCIIPPPTLETHFVWKNTTFRAPAISQNCTKCCACHEK